MKPEMIIENLGSLPALSFDERNKLPETSGIYLIHDVSENEVVYVGKAGNLRARWLNQEHHQKDRMTEDHCIRFLSLVSSEIDSIERKLITLMEPPWNKSYNAQNYIAPSRAGKKQLACWVDAEVQRAVRLLSINEDVPVQALMVEAVKLLLDSRGVDHNLPKPRLYCVASGENSD